MNRRKRPWLRRTLGIALVLLIGLPLAAWLAIRASLPQYEGVARLPGVTAKVQVDRDASGWPASRPRARTTPTGRWVTCTPRSATSRWT
jgi:hypothetical protein